MIIDFHGHVGGFDRIGGRQDVEEMLRVMDLAEIDKACLFNIFHTDAAKANDLTAAFVAAHPNRFIGFLFVTPHYPEEMQDEMIRATDELGLKGIKIYPPYFNRSVEDPAWDPIFAFAQERGLPVISHTDGDIPLVNPNRGEPSMFIQWAEKYPKARIVLAHGGNNPNGRRSCVRAAQRCPNIHIETCTTWRHFRAIEELVEGADEDRVLYGSDMPIMDPRIQMGRIHAANISDRARQKILGENAARLLGL